MTNSTGSIRVVYFGTPAYAVPALLALAADNRFSVVLVVTQPDRPAGRGHELRAPAVKFAALELGLPVYQPASLRTAELRSRILEATPDVSVVAAFGMIFGPKTLAIPSKGCVNLHASLLPAYRGASPVTAAILNGDLETGVTLMEMEPGLDTGPVIDVVRVAIDRGDTTGSLTKRLAVAGAEMTPDALARWVSGELKATPQPERGASFVRPLVKADGWVDWRMSSVAVERLMRAMDPWPRAWTTLENGTTMQIFSGEVIAGDPGAPGEVLVTGKDVSVACGDGAIRLGDVQLAGGARKPAFELISGRKLISGQTLGNSGAPELLPRLIASVE